MKPFRLLSTLSLILVPLVSLSTQAHAELQSRLGGLAYYDTDLDITWMADANLAVSNSFGLPVEALVGGRPPRGNAPAGTIKSDGRMYWPDALSWIDAMNAATYLGHNDWRLPGTLPIGGSTYDTGFTNNATSDVGYADSDGWVDGAGNPVSEMGHLYYVTLGNPGACPPIDASPQSGCSPSRTSPDYGPFSGVQGSTYWSGDSLDTSKAWSFDFGSGYQNVAASGDNSGGCGRGGCTSTSGTYSYAWAVYDGDVSPVPEPVAAWLFVSGLLTLLAAPRVGRHLPR